MKNSYIVCNLYREIYLHCGVQVYHLSTESRKINWDNSGFSRQKGAIYGASETSHIHVCIYINIYIYIYISEKAMAPYSSTFAWKIPWMEESARLQSMGSLRVGYDWVTSLSLFTFMHWRRKWQPTPVFLPEESQGWGNLVAAVYGVTQSRTRLKWLSIA